jgi:aryl-alcohol dehydrogenase-like predicted oxidoreductase
MLPIPGTSHRAHLEDNVAAASVNFTASEMTEIG